jgi:dUTP pyrophosphatase
MKIKNISNNPLPEYATKGSSGMDLRAWLPDGPVTIKPGERVLIGTGLFIDLIRGFELQIRPRSGLALNYGITVLNTPGTIDPGYKDEIKIILVNLGNEDFTVSSGDRVAQMVLVKTEKLYLDLVDELDMRDDRGGGFGHTGIS